MILAFTLTVGVFFYPVYMLLVCSITPPICVRANKSWRIHAFGILNYPEKHDFTYYIMVDAVFRRK